MLTRLQMESLVYHAWKVKKINIQFWLKISWKISQWEWNNIKANCNVKDNNVNLTELASVGSC
jgi:hypothetical protein